MPATFPFLTAYDPAGTSEGTLDPLGLYQIADQLAVQLVPRPPSACIRSCHIASGGSASSWGRMRWRS